MVTRENHLCLSPLAPWNVTFSPSRGSLGWHSHSAGTPHGPSCLHWSQLDGVGMLHTATRPGCPDAGLWEGQVLLLRSWEEFLTSWAFPALERGADRGEQNVTENDVIPGWVPGEQVTGSAGQESYLQALASPPMVPIMEWVAMVMGWGAEKEGASESIASRRGQRSCLEPGQDTPLFTLVPRRPVPGPAAALQSPLPPAPLPSHGLRDRRAPPRQFAGAGMQLLSG